MPSVHVNQKKQQHYFLKTLFGFIQNTCTVHVSLFSFFMVLSNAKVLIDLVNNAKQIYSEKYLLVSGF